MVPNSCGGSKSFTISRAVHSRNSPNIASVLKSLPVPMPYAFHVQISVSRNSKFFYLADFIPSHLALVSCLSLLILQTAVWQPLMPPWESKASFISSAFVMLCFSFTHSFIWDFKGEIFRSQMSLPL